LTGFYFSLGLIYQQELTNEMKLVQLTEETHKAVKVLAVNEGISLKDLVERLLKSAMKGAVK